MDTSSYDARIQSVATEKSALLTQLEAACKEYMQVCVEFFQAEFRSRTENAITSNPETTQSLGVEKLHELKHELKDMIGRVPDIVSDRLNRSDVWEHRNPIPEGIETSYSPGFDLYYHAGNKAQDELREIYGHVGQLLIKYGFASAGKDSEWENRPNALPKYRYGMTLSKEVGSALENYKGLFERFVKKHVEGAKIEREKQQALAKALWDEA